MTEYGSVALTLNSVFLPPEKLYPNPTPSMLDGLSYEVEYDLRLVGCELIQTACLLLQLPQTAVATGQVLFHRYFYSSSFVRRPFEYVAMACVTLAAKIEENARRIRDVINVFTHIKQVRSGKTIHPVMIDQAYVDKKNEVIKAERRLLKELGFCVYVKHPHKIIMMYLKALEKVQEKKLVQSAWNYMNDSLRTDIFLRYTPETIACACIDLAARFLQIPLPKNPSWYLIFGARPDEVHQIMFAILRLYRHRPKSIDELEKLVSLVRDKREDGRKKSRFEPIQSTAAASPQPAIPLASTNIVETSTTAVGSTTAEVSTTVTTEKPIEPIATISNGKSDKDSSNKKSHRTRKYSRSRSTSRSPSRSQRKKKSSHRNRSRSRSNSSRREKYHKDKHYRSHSSHHRRKKDRKRRSSSSSSSSVSPADNRSSSSYHQKHPLSTKDTNHNLHSSKQQNGVSSHRKFKN